MTKKVGIYDPYLDTLGGGERYCLSVAEILLKDGYKVDLFWSKDQSLIKKAEDRFSLNLEGINIVPDIFEAEPKSIDLIHNGDPILKNLKKSISPFGIRDKIHKITHKYNTTKKYDVFFYLSDGSNPFLFSKNNILHIQVPFTTKTIKPQFLLTPLKAKLFKHIICNSKFTAKFASEFYHHKIDVLYPPVDICKFDPTTKKENIILSVGRFDNILNSKKQDFLIDSFIKLIKEKNINDWKLVLIGGSLQDPDKNSYLNLLQTSAKDYPIEILVNPSFPKLKETYEKSKIYWHATGWQVDQDINPQNTEHFGMTVVEAMSAGLVPVCINKGGIPEIIIHDKTGYLWDTQEQIIEYTNNLIEDEKLFENMQTESIKQSKIFSKENFEQELLQIINQK